MDTIRADTANARFKESFRSRVWASICLSVALHLAFFAFFPPIGVAELNGEDTREAPQDSFWVPIPDIPPPPKTIDSPPPPISDPMIPVPDLKNVVERPPIPPIKPPDIDTKEPARNVEFLVVDVPPKLLDPEKARREVRRRYPRLLRRADIGGKVEVVAVVDTLGWVVDVRLGRSSGYEALDEAALEAVRQFRYSPAMNRDRRVRVQIRIPVEFEVR